MSGRIVAHDRVPWVTGVIRKISSQSFAIDMTCSRCGERLHRRFCCFDKAKNLGLECFAKLHFQCVVKPQKETVL